MFFQNHFKNESDRSVFFPNFVYELYEPVSEQQRTIYVLERNEY